MKKRASVFFLLPILALLISTGVFMHLASAGAAPTSKFPIHGMKPYSRHNSAAAPAVTNSNLTYHGGPVMAGTAHNYLIFWEPSGSTVTPKYNQLIKKYFQSVGSSGLYKNNQQYANSNGQAPLNAVLAGTFTDKASYPANPMTDTQVQAEVTHAMSVKHWTTSINNIFYVFTAGGEHNTIADANGFCAYHSAFGTGTIYAAIVYPTVFPGGGCLVPLPSPNHDQIADSAIDFSSHEQMEAATDPFLNAWYNVDFAHEIGDECNFVFGPRNSSGGDVTFGSHTFLVQEEWDNARSGCVISGP